MTRAIMAARVMRWNQLERLVKLLVPDLAPVIAQRRRQALARPVNELELPTWSIR